MVNKIEGPKLVLMTCDLIGNPVVEILAIVDYEHKIRGQLDCKILLR